MRTTRRTCIAQTDEPVLKPELPYEKTGQYAAGTTFAEGLVYFHGQWFLYYGCADSLVAVAWRRPQPPADVARGFYLHRDDTVVFYGDSITEQNFYNQWVELYTVTRFPLMRVHFYDAGVGGDRVTGGWADPIDQRLARDVFPREADGGHHHAGHERRRLPADNAGDRDHLRERL